MSTKSETDMEQEKLAEDETAPGNVSSLDWAYDRIKSAIMCNELKPGSVVSQVQLAKIVGVSRTPLREALRLLQYEGLVNSEHNRQVRISELSNSDLEQLYALRITNEAMAIRLSVPLMTEEDDHHLESLLVEMSTLQQQGDVDQWEPVHHNFHRALIYRAGSRIVKTIDRLSDHAERYRRAFISSIPRAWSMGEPEHAAIVAACIARDPQAAAVQLANHLGRTALFLLMHNAPEYEPAIVRAAIRAVTGSNTEAN